MTVLWVLTWVGQSAALAALTAAFVRLPGCRSSAAARAGAWSLALLLSAGFLVFPVFTGLAPATAALRDGAALRVPGRTLTAPVILPSAAAWWLAKVVWVWAVGSIVWLAMVARDARRVVRLKEAARPFSPEEQGRLGPWLNLLSRTRGARLCWCDGLDGPAALGLGGPMIALPRDQASRLTDEDLQHVVLHELAHVRRRDDWSVLAEGALVALMWVNPAAHWIRRHLALAREMACDEWAVRQTASAAAYAACLTTVAELRSRKRTPRLAAAITGRQSALGRRVLRVLELDRRRPTRLARAAAGLAPASVALVAIGLMQLPPVFVLEQEPAGIATPLVAKPSPAGIMVASMMSAPARPDVGPSPAAPVRQVAPVPALSSSESDSIGRSRGGVPQAPVDPVPVSAPVSQSETGGGVLDAVPLPGAGAAGVAAREAAPGGTLPRADAAARWWGGPAALGAATGDGTAAAGRATASFFKRLGSRVPQLVKR